MNRLLLNGGSLNGAIRGLVFATAAIVCTASVSAAAVRVATAEGAFTGQAACTANATYNHSTAAVNFAGGAQLYPSATHTHTCQAALQGSCQISAYVLRSVSSAANIFAGAEIIAVVASTQGQGAFAGHAYVTPVATRVQSARANTAGAASVTINAHPVITRMPHANVLGTVSVRAEPTINGLALSFVDFVASAEVVADALCTRMAQTNLHGQAEAFATGTLQQPGYAVALNTGVMTVVAEPYVKATLLANLAVTANVQATGVVVKMASGHMQGQADIQSSALQHHAGQSALMGSVSVIAVPQVTSELFATLSTNAQVSAGAVRYAMASALSDGTVGIIAAGMRLTPGEASLSGGAEVVCLPDTTVRQAQANTTSGAEVIAEAGIDRTAEANLICTADITAIAHRLFMADPVVLVCTAEVYADTVANPEAVDPEHRTYYRPADITEFVRPVEETLFRRTA